MPPRLPIAPKYRIILFILNLIVLWMIYDLYFYKGGFLPFKKTYKEYYTNGQLRWKSSAIDGVPEGKAVGYYESGRLRMEVIFKDGKLNGPAKNYYANGNLRSEGEYKDDLTHGLWKFYFETGQLQTEEMHATGKKNGLFKGYGLDGHLTGQGEYRDDKSQGHWTWFYTNGNPSQSAYYNDGVLASKFVCYDNVPPPATGEAIGHECSDVKESEADFGDTDQVRQLAEKGFQLYKEGKYANSYNGGYYTEPNPDTAVLDFWSDGKRVKVDRHGNGHHETIYEIKNNDLIYIGTLGADGSFIDHAK